MWWGTSKIQGLQKLVHHCERCHEWPGSAFGGYEMRMLVQILRAQFAGVSMFVLSGGDHTLTGQKDWLGRGYVGVGAG